jgi:outer membrane biosynthesis protein TonB
MNTYKICLLLAASAGAVSVAHAQASVPNESPAFGASATAVTRNFNEATSETGTIIKKEVRWDSKIPLNKTYGQLTPEQKDYFHAMYEALKPGDEPPFPLEGIKPIINAINKGQSMMRARGELNLTVTVGPDGKATEVADYGSTRNREMLNYAASILLMTKFKPAVCSGKPCTMQFPFALKLTGG